MEVTNDKYELPIAVGGSAAELGRILGIGRSAVFKKMQRSLESEKYPYMRTKVVAVEIDDVD